MFAVPRVKLAGSERGAMPGARVARKIREDERFEVTVCRIAIKCRQGIGLHKSRRRVGVVAHRVAGGKRQTRIHFYLERKIVLQEGVLGVRLDE
jgi:hypothetical protein